MYHILTPTAPVAVFLPGTRSEFWRAKIEANRKRDSKTYDALRGGRWRVLTVWECSVKGPARMPLQDVLCACADFVQGNLPSAVLAGSWPQKRSMKKRSIGPKRSSRVERPGP
jgi:DNA mismatch endonuclease, patch repair protein